MSNRFRFPLLGLLASSLFILHGCPAPLAGTPQNPAPTRAQFELADCNQDGALSEQEAQYFEFYLPPANRAFGGNRIDFRVADTNWNGALSFEELSRYLVYNQKVWNVNQALDATSIDCDDDGTYSLGEMSGVVVTDQPDPKTSTKQYLERLVNVAELQAADKNQDWSFTPAELREVLGAIGCGRWSFKPNCSGNSGLTVSTPNSAMGTFFAHWFPTDVAIDGAGNLWVTGADATVVKLSAEGKFLAQHWLPDAFGTIAIDPAGNVWVLLAGITERGVAKLSSTGKALGTFELEAKPLEVAFDGAGNAWVVTEDNVVKLSPSGATLGTFTTPDDGRDIAIDGAGRVWVASEKRGVVQLSADGQVAREVAVSGTAQDLTLDEAGNVWVFAQASNAVGSVIKLSPDGKTLTSQDVGVGKGRLFSAPSGQVWLVRSDLNEVIKLDADGKKLNTYQSGRDPSGLAFDASGQAWVTYQNSHVLKRLTP